MDARRLTKRLLFLPEARVIITLHEGVDGVCFDSNVDPAIARLMVRAALSELEGAAAVEVADVEEIE